MKLLNKIAFINSMAIFIYLVTYAVGSSDSGLPTLPLDATVKCKIVEITPQGVKIEIKTGGGGHRTITLFVPGGNVCVSGVIERKDMDRVEAAMQENSNIQKADRHQEDQPDDHGTTGT